MPRVPYVPADLAEPREIVDAVRARRGGTLINLDRMLLHSPEMAMGWNTYLGAIRTRLQLSPKLRELAICTVAVLNGADYEFHQHAPEFLKAGGTPAQLDALRDPERAQRDDALFDDTERAALAVAVEMTRPVEVSDASFDALARRLGVRDLVEFVGTVATYNMVSRFLVALGIELE
ncbi:MAG: carboxymuconolactone decarboxylase family protein [Burkholderiales bacterium]|nr:MAG: carboxymuconolactone decarboxylase family protein [Burkholderiales bacterium]